MYNKPGKMFMDYTADIRIQWNILLKQCFHYMILVI